MNAEIILSKRALLTPRREALFEANTGRRLTFAELEERAARTGRWLSSCGVQPGDRIALLAHNSALYVDLLFACMKIGAIFNPLNWRLAGPELVYIINDSEPALLICGPEFTETLAAIRPQLRVPEIAACEDAVIPNARIMELETAGQPSKPFKPLQVEPEQTACILYTSGTTGRPKGALISHRQILWNAINTVVSWELGPRDISPILTPMFHSGGLFVFLTPLLYAGGRLIVTRQFDAAAALELIETESCTVILGVPTLFQMWLDSPQLPQTDFSAVRWFISGGAPCPIPLMTGWRAATGTILRQGYGLTEAGVNCFTMTNEEAVSKAGSVGKPIFHSEMRLVDDHGREVDRGETGELLIKGPHVMSGYWRSPQATAAALVDGWLHTGDMARQDDEGFFAIAGRFKDMIISGGENIYAAEVEAVFLEHPAVKECALIGKPDEKWGEVGLLIVVPQETSITADILLDHCRAQLARYKVPKEIIFAGALPYSPYGKVEKLKLKEKYLKTPEE